MDMSAIIKRMSYIMLFTLLFGCPSSDDDCFDQGSSSRIDNLISLTPEQEVFSHGDEIVFKVNIPANNTYFGRELNILQETNDYSGLLITNYDLFIDNGLNFIKGNQGEYNNWFNMPFNPETENYELLIVITLNRIGQYSFLTSDSIEFAGNDCDRFRLDTDFDWTYNNGRVEFIVE